jgi:uncharacterized peroxidase-related enzyme
MDMAFIKTIPAAEATDEVRAMYARQQAEWGYVPDYARVFCHRPEVMARWGRLLAEIKRPVDPRRLELATFAAAHELRHSPCSLAHGAKLADLMDKETVLAIADGREEEVLPPAEAAIVRFARRIARDASKITFGEVEALKTIHGFSDAEVFDIAAIAAARSFFTKVLDALGSEPDLPFMKLNTELRQKWTVGRPINHRAPDSLIDDPRQTGMPAQTHSP